MRADTILLWMVAILSIGFGAGFIVMPEMLALWMTGVASETANAITDMRATYGGMALGLGLFLGGCASRADRARTGLSASLWVLGAIALGRVVGMLMDGGASAVMIGLLVLELVFIVLVVSALNRSGAKTA